MESASMCNSTLTVDHDNIKVCWISPFNEKHRQYEFCTRPAGRKNKAGLYSASWSVIYNRYGTNYALLYKVTSLERIDFRAPVFTIIPKEFTHWDSVYSQPTIRFSKPAVTDAPAWMSIIDLLCMFVNMGPEIYLVEHRSFANKQFLAIYHINPW